MEIVAGKTIEEWKTAYPLIEKVIQTDEVFWGNPIYKKFDEAIQKISLSEKDVRDAEARLLRFAPYIAKVFPETKK